MISVLVADDDKPFIRYITEVINASPPLEVTCYAYDGKNAAVVAKENVPAVAVIDLVMPRMNGVELTRELRKINQHMVIIILTGSQDPELQAAAIKAGADIVLTKTDFAEQLVSYIAERGHPRQ